MTPNEKNRKTNDEISEAARMARNAYQREWAKKNSEKVKAYRQRYWERMARKMSEEA